jgi:rare lipoprotein A
MGNRRAVVFACVIFSGSLLVSCGKKKHARGQVAIAPIRSTEIGGASWYGHPYHGRAAANGEIYDMENMTAAHRTLPFNTWVRVTNLNNNKSVDVRIIDRGPFIAGRIIDLSHAAAQVIELIGPGVAQVRVDLLSVPASIETVASTFAVQVGAFEERARAERLRAALGAQYGTARIQFRDGRPPLWRVLVGSETSMDAANALAQKLQAEVGSAFVVRLDGNAANGLSTLPTP